jgi:hypothetical protein
MARIDESPKLVRDLTELHDRIANACIRAIVTEPLHIGGDSADCMLIVASVVMGVMNSLRSMGRDSDADLVALVNNVRGRLPEPVKVTVPGLYGNA